jgi:hypothetical protein
MFKTTINLESELLKTNKTVVSADELLFVKEYEKVGHIDASALERVGISTVSDGKNIVTKNKKFFDDVKNFDQSRVFHISQIKEICLKYNLRFLHSSLYKGTIDEQLILKIGQFELAHNKELYSKSVFNNNRKDYVYDDANNSFIIAPKDSFKLLEKPIDPLFFYKINDEYFYLIHKWGNDLSLFRKYVFSVSLIKHICIPIILALISLLCSLLFIDESFKIGFYCAAAVSSFVAVMILVGYWENFSEDCTNDFNWNRPVRYQ